MVLKAIQKLNVNGALLKDLPRVFSMIQEHIIQAVGPLLRDPFLDGHILPDVVLTGGGEVSFDNVIEHKLGRKYQGFMITKTNVGALVYVSSTENLTPHLTIILRCSQNATVDLRVF